MQLSSSSAPRRRWTAALFGAAAAFLFAGTASAQVAFTKNFDVDSTGWTGNFSRYTGTTACGGAGGAMRRNLYGSAPTGELISPSTGTSLGGLMTMSFDYKVCNWSANTVGTPAPFGTIDVQYGATATGPWTTFLSFTDEPQSGLCLPKSTTFTPPAGPLFVRFSCTRSAGTSDSYWNFDNVVITETLSACSGTPTPGNTTAPAGGVCPGVNFTLGLQNSTVGSGVTYQWYSSTVSATGPWTSLGTGATQSASQTVTTWYYCDVTCSAGPSTGSSNVVQVDMATTAWPQDFASGVISPNCWSTSALVGTSLPDYNAASAFGAGTGSARWNFYSISNLNQPVLTSPSFAAVAGGTQVYFDVAGCTYTGGEVDSIVLEESNDSGANWTSVVTMTNAPGGLLNTIGGTGTSGSNFVPTASQWASLAYSLSAGTNRIRFRGISNFGNTCFLDNISVGVMPSARHTKYGAGCGTAPVMSLNSATPPIAGATILYDLADIPLACPSPDPVFYFGIIGISLGQDFAGTDLLTGYGVEAPGCKLHLASLDIVLGYVDTVPTQQVPFTIPGFTVPGFLFYSQAAALICPVAPNNAGILLSNGLRSYVNTF